jgi:cytochrome c oxidase subunit 2
MIFDMIRTISHKAVGRGMFLAATLASPLAYANEYGHAVPDQLGLMKSVTGIGDYIDWFHNWLLLPIITVISLFVLALLIYVIVKFNAKANPTPSRTTHSTVLELAWTIIPVLILVVIAIPSFRLLNMQLTFPKADLTIKVTGKQWYWSYDYPKEEGDFGFDSFIKPEKDLKPGDLRMLAVDNEAVVPVGKVVRLQIVAADVIHSFVIQSFGVRIDAVPGRLNETWFKAEREGVYYGQCSKICGKDHAFMPIAFRVVSEDAYKKWAVDAKKKFARAASPNEFAESGASAVKQ